MSRGTGNPGMGDPYEQGYIAGMREVYYSVPAENIYDQPGEEYDSEQWYQGYIVGIVNAKKKNWNTKMNKLPGTMSVFKRTDDEWCPNYKIEDDARVSGLVEVSFIKLTDGEWRVCVWGADDLGMEKDFATAFGNGDALDCFLTVIAMETVDMPVLKKMGFVYA